MPIINTDDAIIAGLKSVAVRRNQRRLHESQEPEEPACNPAPNQGDVAQPIEISDENEITAEPKVIIIEPPPQTDTKALDDVESNQLASIPLLPPSESYMSADSRAKDLDGASSTDSAGSGGSYLSEEPQESDKSIPNKGKVDEKIVSDTNINAIVQEVIKAVQPWKVEKDQVQVKPNKLSFARKDAVGDRRRNTWV